MATKKNKKPAAAKKAKAKTAPKAKTAAKKQRKVVASAPKQKLVRKTVKNTRANLPTSFDIEQATISVMAREKNRAEYRDALYASSSPFYVGNDFAYPGPAEIWMLLTAFDEGRPLSSVITELKVAQERTLSSMLPVQINHDARAGAPTGRSVAADGVEEDPEVLKIIDEIVERSETNRLAKIRVSMDEVLGVARFSEEKALTFLKDAGVPLSVFGIQLPMSHWMTFSLDTEGWARCLWTHDGNRGEPIEFKKQIEDMNDLFVLLRNAQRGVAFHIQEIIKTTGSAPVPLSTAEVENISTRCGTHNLTMACVVNGKPVLDIMDDHVIPMEVPAYVAAEYVVGVDGPALVHADTKVEAAEPLNLSTEPLAVEEIAGLPELSHEAASVAVAAATTDPVSVVIEAPVFTATTTVTVPATGDTYDVVSDDDLPF